jgi:MFS family permease
MRNFMENRVVRNALANIVGESLWGLQAALVASATVLTIILKDYGAGKTMISSIMTIETIGFIMPQMVGVILFRRWALKRVPLVVWHLVTVIPCILLMAALLWVAPHAQAVFVRWAVLVCYACMVVSIGVIISVWMDWLARLFDTGIRGTVLGLTFGASALAGAAGTLVSGWLLRVHPGTGIYPVLYLIAGTLAAVGICAFLFVGERTPAPPADDGSTETWGKIMSSVKKSLADVAFRRFLLARILTAAGFSVMPFVTLYYMSDHGGKMSGDMVVSVSVAMTAGMTVGNVGLGRMGDRLGHRSCLLLGAALQVVTLLILLLTTGIVSCAVVFFLAGICLSAGFISHYNMLFETCRHGARVVHITAGNFVFSAGSAAIPLLGGVVASCFGLRAVFAASLVLSAAAVLCYLLFVKEPRNQTPDKSDVQIA